MEARLEQTGVGLVPVEDGARLTLRHGTGHVRARVARIGECVELLCRHTRPGALAEEREHVGDNCAGAGHPLDLLL